MMNRNFSAVFRQKVPQELQQPGLGHMRVRNLRLTDRADYCGGAIDIRSDITPKGVPSQSPGSPCHGAPWDLIQEGAPTPKGLHQSDQTPLGYLRIGGKYPGCAASRRPWALGFDAFGVKNSLDSYERTHTVPKQSKIDGAERSDSLKSSSTISAWGEVCRDEIKYEYKREGLKRPGVSSSFVQEEVQMTSGAVKRNQISFRLFTMMTPARRLNGWSGPLDSQRGSWFRARMEPFFMPN